METPQSKQETFVLIQNHKLKDEQFNNVKNLFSICQIHDTINPKIYWDLLKEERAQGENFLLYLNHDGETIETNASLLVGYLSYFFFDNDITEFSALVHPDYRDREVFVTLFKKACENIIKFSNTNKVSFLLPQGENTEIKRCIEALKGVIVHLEYHLARTSHNLETIPHHQLKVQKAANTDLNLLADIHLACFQCDFDLMLERFQDTMKQANRETWLCYHDDICIGKIHIRFDSTDAYIHDFCILPQYQNAGNGKIFLQSIINYLIDEKKCKYIYVDVISGEETNLNLYIQCNFKIKNTYEFWCVDII